LKNNRSTKIDNFRKQGQGLKPLGTRRTAKKTGFSKILIPVSNNPVCFAATGLPFAQVPLTGIRPD
jgi:hypothetical protein